MGKYVHEEGRAVSANATPPPEVTLIYRELGKTHIFTVAELRGFHVGSSSRSFVFNQLAEALSEHVSLVYGCKAQYRLEVAYEEFEARLNGGELRAPFLIAKRAEEHAVA
jgi:hypothetical protein